MRVRAYALSRFAARTRRGGLWVAFSGGVPRLDAPFEAFASKAHGLLNVTPDS